MKFNKLVQVVRTERWIIYLITIPAFAFFLALIQFIEGDVQGKEMVVRPKDYLISLTSGSLFGYFFARNMVMKLKVRKKSEVDFLTGIFNRRKFMELYRQELDRSTRYGHPFCLIFFDLDHFKKVNDHYGHHTGDKVLSRLTQVVQKNIRKVDVFARWGGEEFILLVPEQDLLGGQQCAEKLRLLIEGLLFANDLRLTASFGVAVSNPGINFEALFQKADKALYIAKNEGRNRVC